MEIMLANYTCFISLYEMKSLIYMGKEEGLYPTIVNLILAYSQLRSGN